MVSRGFDFPHCYVEPHVEMTAASRRACVFPRSNLELEQFASVFLDGDGGDGQIVTGCVNRVVSVGCGEAFLEGLLQSCLAEAGIQVVGVDLDSTRDPLGYLEHRCFLREGRRLLANSSILFDLGSPSEQKATALLFCFGRRCPLESYLEAFPHVAMVVILADDAGDVCQPGARDLEGAAGWERRLKCSGEGGEGGGQGLQLGSVLGPLAPAVYVSSSSSSSSSLAAGTKEEPHKQRDQDEKREEGKKEGAQPP